MPTADNPVPTHAPAPNLTNVTIEKKKITATIQTRKKNEGITCTLLMLDNGETMIVVGTEADIHEALGW